MENEEMIAAAIRAREMAVAPYSNFKVGAVAVTADGKVYTGCNVENSTYGLTMCAERVAIFKALSEGAHNIVKVVVVADTPQPCYPCGACRQIIWDFAPKADVVCANLKNESKVFKAGELIPYAFGDGDLTNSKK